MSIGSARREVGEERAGPNGSIPGPRTAADAYRVSDDQIHRARLVVARNCADPDDLHRYDQAFEEWFAERRGGGTRITDERKPPPPKLASLNA